MTNQQELIRIITQLKIDSGIDMIGVRARTIDDIREINPWVSEDTIGIYIPAYSYWTEYNPDRYIYIETGMFNEEEASHADLLWVIYHEVAHAMTENIYGLYNAHEENFQDTLEALVEDGFAAGTLTQEDLDRFEFLESEYNPDNVDRDVGDEDPSSGYILNDEPDTTLGLAIPLLEDNPHEAGTLRADRWELIQKGWYTDAVEGDMLEEYWFDYFSNGDDEITLEDLLENISKYEGVDGVDAVLDKDDIEEITRNFNEIDALITLDGVIDYDEFTLVWYNEPTTLDEITPNLLDLDFNGEVNISDIIDILRDIVGLEELSDSEFVLADANRDGVVDISDAIDGLRVIVGLTTVEDLANDFFVPALDIN